jgi:hypothetical protein
MRRTLRARDKVARHAQPDDEALSDPDVSIVAQSLLGGRMCNGEHKQAKRNEERSCPNDISEVTRIQEASNGGREEQNEERLSGTDKVELKLILVPKSMSDVVGGKSPIGVH